jgi:hypothetical protein
MIDDESRVLVRAVKVSRQIGGEVVIASGVRAGDQVITEIPQALQEGARVRLVGTEGAVDKGKAGSKGKKGGRKGEANAERGPKG